MSVALTTDQQAALAEIVGAMQPGARHLLTGYAGSGKTTLMQVLAKTLVGRGQSVVLTAPTHKAVSVLAAKLRGAGVDGVDCRTIHSLLSLRPKTVADRQVFVRERRADPVMADVVIIDECSMLGEDMMAHIRRYLPVSFVLFVGDPAQLPPIGEIASQSFSIKARSHLATIVRQDAANPLLDAAHSIRSSQGGPIDWSWCKSAKAPPLGVYLPRDADAWMKEAFTSPEFEADPDRFRYLAWTNARVADVNRKVRQWRYGSAIPTPFMPGEMAMLRAPVVRDKRILLNTNEEARVIEIAHASVEWTFAGAENADGWRASLPTWRVVLRRADGDEIAVDMASDDATFSRIIARATDEAAESRGRWQEIADFKASLAKLQSIYAMTVHTSQGSTFRNAFIDVPDIRRRAATNVLETQQMLYVAVTRPSHAAVLVGAA